MERPSAPDRWEAGSEYEWTPIPPGECLPLPTPHVLYALAQHGLIALWHHLSRPGGRPRLWVPDYFCPPVTEVLRRAGIPIRRFEDDPLRLAPRLETLRPDPGDLVLDVNYFGMRAGSGLGDWLGAHRDVRVIEDHSHDPMSTWARESVADFAIASLRKTLPIPDGGIVWSPIGHPLPPPPTHTDTTGSALKSAGMVLKRAYLSGGSVEKAAYRDLLSRGEAALLAGRDLAIAPWSRELVERGVPREWRERRRRNVRTFIARTARDRRFTAVPDGAGDTGTPFNAILVFARAAERDAIHRALLAQDVYATVHWRQLDAAPSRVRDLGSRLLTIPLDQRYDLADVARVVAILEGLGDGEQVHFERMGPLPA